MGLLSMLRETLQRSASGKKQVLKAQCPKCKAPVDTSMERCPSCGTHIESMFRLECPDCHTQNPLKAERCSKCGRVLLPPPAQPAKSYYTCPICGYKADYYMLSCPSCGTRFV